MFADSVSACLCAGGSRKEVFARVKKQATVIFVGRVIEVTNGFSTGEFRGWRAKFKVTRFWKSQLTDEVLVGTGPDDCAVHFVAGEEYLVLAYVPEGAQQLFTNVCMKTGLTKYSTKDLKTLGKGKTINR